VVRQRWRQGGVAAAAAGWCSGGDRSRRGRVCVGESEMWGPGGRAREVVSPLSSVGSPPADGS
jgi:hypothetical protein